MLAFHTFHRLVSIYLDKNSSYYHLNISQGMMLWLQYGFPLKTHSGSSSDYGNLKDGDLLGHSVYRFNLKEVIRNG